MPGFGDTDKRRGERCERISVLELCAKIRQC